MSDDNKGDEGGADEALKKILAKNEELLNELKVAKAKARELEQAEADRKAELAKREEEQLLKEGNYQKLLETEKQRASEKEGEALLYRAKYEEREIDLGLTSALTSAGVKPEFMRAASTMLKGEAELSESGVALRGKPLADAIKEWAASDEGKAFVANGNAGGGAEGGGKGKQPAQKAGNLGGSKADRVAALKNRFPDLPER